MEPDPLKSARQKSAVPLPRRDRLRWPNWPVEVRTTKPGQVVAFASQAVVDQDPIAGRPEMVVPVFMKVWAGSWLIASVTIERMMQISSATVAMCGKMALISWPLWPHSERMLRREADQLLAPELRDRLALVNDSGIGLPCILARVGLKSRFPGATGRRPCTGR